ncbi:MAG: flavodoxin family protein [Clostridiales bacterium]|nr:flavodoxin family protein [Clostridiales bacterium]
MKVLLFNGSPRANGCTFTALSEVAATLNAEGIETEIVWLGNKPVRDCIGCNGCAGKGKCVFADDDVNEWIEKATAADGFVFGSPVYYAHPDGRILCVMDRLFYAGGKNFAQKPASVVVSARRAGTTASLDALTKHLTIAQMPVVSSTYWNMVHGKTPDEVKQDLEGLQTMRNLAHNMAWLLKCIKAGEAAGITKPQNEKKFYTNFIR